MSQDPNTTEANTTPAEPTEATGEFIPTPPDDPRLAEASRRLEMAGEMIRKLRQDNAAMVAQLETAGLSLQTARETIERERREKKKALEIIEAERKELAELRALHQATEARRDTAAALAKSAESARDRFKADADRLFGERNYQERRNLALFELVDRLLIHTTDPELHKAAEEIRSGEPEKLESIITTIRRGGAK